jgi:crotonobetainyl-CoA:carnitine CoA-transferase CaiB-like acyl-CoA transferase
MSPLAGIKVLDLSRILAGPWATQCLADFGATVWKIEKPGSGDDTRHWGPPWIPDGKGKPTRDSAYFASTNRGKFSLAIDFTKPSGQRLIRSLALRADVLIENFKVGTLAKYHLGHESLMRMNPRLVYCSISAYGQDGPAAAEPGYDAMIQAISGLMSITGVPDGQPGAGPVKVGVAVSDLISGLYAANAITAALVEREQSGRGDYIDLALLDVQVAALANQALNYLITGKPPGRRGTAHPNIVPYQAFRTKDAWLMLAVGNDKQYQAFCKAAGKPALGKDKRFRSNADRVSHRDVLIPAIEKLCRQKTTATWLRRLAKAGVPCGPINNLAEVFDEPQVKHRKLRFEVRHAHGARLPQVRQPALFARMSSVSGEPPPLLGAHTESVLSDELGLTSDEILSLKGDGTIGQFRRD